MDDVIVAKLDQIIEMLSAPSEGHEHYFHIRNGYEHCPKCHKEPVKEPQCCDKCGTRPGTSNLCADLSCPCHRPTKEHNLNCTCGDCLKIDTSYSSSTNPSEKEMHISETRELPLEEVIVHIKRGYIKLRPDWKEKKLHWSLFEL